MGIPSRQRQGVTLSEILVAVAILAFALVPIFSFMRTGSRGVQGTRDVAAAAYLAAQALESLRAWPFARLAEEDPPDPTGTLTGPSGEETFRDPARREVTMSGVRFLREVDVKPLYPAGGPELKLVKVRVTWKRGEADLHYEATTAVSSAP